MKEKGTFPTAPSAGGQIPDSAMRQSESKSGNAENPPEGNRKGKEGLPSNQTGPDSTGLTRRANR